MFKKVGVRAGALRSTYELILCINFSNEFEDYGSISFLFICPKLENLVLKGNPISYEPEYRQTIFRILPSLKNLDVITMKRVARTICKKDPSPSDDNFEGPSPMAVSTNSNEFPKELEGT